MNVWIHGSVEDTKLSTNKQHTLSLMTISIKSFTIGNFVEINPKHA
jgi:hypothetical protein